MSSFKFQIRTGSLRRPGLEKENDVEDLCGVGVVSGENLVLYDKGDLF